MREGVKGLVQRLVREKRFWWYGFCQFLSIVFFVVLFRYRVFGRDRVPAEGGVLVVSNHQSFFDPVLVGLGLGRQIHIMAREGLFRVPGFSTLIRSLNAFPVKRGAFDREAIRRALDVLERGDLLLVFPEGTRTRDGSLLVPKPGIGLLARRAGVKVVPAVIRGAFEAWPSHRLLFRAFVPLAVAFGEPVESDRGGPGVESRIADRWAGLMDALGKRNV